MDNEDDYSPEEEGLEESVALLNAEKAEKAQAVQATPAPQATPPQQGTPPKEQTPPQQATPTNQASPAPAKEQTASATNSTPVENKPPTVVTVAQTPEVAEIINDVFKATRLKIDPDDPLIAFFLYSKKVFNDALIMNCAEIKKHKDELFFDLDHRMAQLTRTNKAVNDMRTLLLTELKVQSQTHIKDFAQTIEQDIKESKQNINDQNKAIARIGYSMVFVSVITLAVFAVLLMMIHKL